MLPRMGAGIGREARGGVGDADHVLIPDLGSGSGYTYIFGLWKLVELCTYDTWIFLHVIVP